MDTVTVWVDEGDQFALISASSLIAMGKGRVGKLIVSAGAADVTALLYDGRDAAGNPIIQVSALIGDTKGVDLEMRIEFKQGLYILVNGAGGRVFASFITTE